MKAYLELQEITLLAKKAGQPINPDNIETLTTKYLEKIPYKSWGCRYNSYVHYFAMLQALKWMEPSGIIENTEFQENDAQGQPRIFFRLTDKVSPHRTASGLTLIRPSTATSPIWF